ncbi:MAG: LysR family transcriptional regulator [Myxococcaceae bacterium]|nr:MAG: LysR family transcriptional regulator [Myxococcaceae bacterium]
MRDNPSMSIDSLDELRAFVGVADAGSFTAAARRLGLTTNAVSQRVQRLEAALGVRLFVRTTRSVALTDEATVLHGRVSRVLADLEAAEAELHPKDEALRGTVRIALPGQIATGAFLGRLREVLEAHPALNVQTRVVNGPVSLAAEGLDIALVVGQPPETSFVGRLLGRANWVLAASPAYLDLHGRPRTPRDLSDHRCLRLLASPPQREWTLVDRRGRETVVRVDGNFEADDSRTLGDAAYAGLGIGIRPARECRKAAKAGLLERVLPGHRFQPLDVYALLPQGRGRIPRVAACLDALRAAVGELS